MLCFWENDKFLHNTLFLTLCMTDNVNHLIRSHLSSIALQFIIIQSLKWLVNAIKTCYNIVPHWKKIIQVTNDDSSQAFIDLWMVCCDFYEKPFSLMIMIHFIMLANNQDILICDIFWFYPVALKDLFILYTAIYPDTFCWKKCFKFGFRFKINFHYWMSNSR